MMMPPCKDCFSTVSQRTLSPQIDVAYTHTGKPLLIMQLIGLVLNV